MEEQTSLVIKNTDISKETVTLNINSYDTYLIQCDTSVLYENALISIYSADAISDYAEYVTCVAIKNDVPTYFIVNSGIPVEIAEEISHIDSIEFDTYINTVNEFVLWFISGRLDYNTMETTLKRLNLHDGTGTNTYNITYNCSVVNDSVDTIVNEINTESNKFISSMDYVPDFQRDYPIFKDASKLLDILLDERVYEDAVTSVKQAYDNGEITEKEYEDRLDDLETNYKTTIQPIQQAYCDTLYKYSTYSKLSYNAKKTFIEEKGFGYLLDLLLHMYDDEYNTAKNEYIKGHITTLPDYDDFVEQKADKALTNIVNLFNLINALKGKTLGLELVLNLVDMPTYLYLPFNVIFTDERTWQWNDSIERLPLPNGSTEVKTGDVYFIINCNVTTKPVDDKNILTIGGEVVTDSKGNPIAINKQLTDSLNVRQLDDKKWYLTINEELYYNEQEELIELPEELVTPNSIKTHYIFNGVAWHQFNPANEYRIPRERLTAMLEIQGGGRRDENLTADLQKRVNTFVKNYMLPLIDVTVKFTHAFPTVYAYPSGIFDSYKVLWLMDYYPNGDLSNKHDQTSEVAKSYIVSDNPIHVQKDLIHKFSDEHWYASDTFTPAQIPITPVEPKGTVPKGTVTVGVPVNENAKAFTGMVDLNDSFVEDETGKRVNLFGYEPTVSEFCTGPAIIDKIYDEEGIVHNYYQEGIEHDYDEYVQVKLDNYIELDFETGEQINPHWENGEFVRDVFINHYKCLTLHDIHLRKTVEQMNYYPIDETVNSVEDLPETTTIGKCYGIKDTVDRYLFTDDGWELLSYPDITIGDFDSSDGALEVYLGMSTTVDAISGKTHDTPLADILQANKTKYKDELGTNGVPLSAMDSYIKYYLIAHDPKAKIEEKADNYEIITRTPTYYDKFNAEREISNLLEKYPLLVKLSETDKFYTFTMSEPELKDETGKDVYHLKYCEESVNDNYTGLGDLGILGSNDYFIYNGMLMYHGIDRLKQVGEDNTWTDVGAAHAISDTYYTPAINNGNIFYIYEGNATHIDRDLDITVYKNGLIEHGRNEVHELNREMSNEELEEETIRDFVEDWYTLNPEWDEIETNRWTSVTGYINDFYTAFGICDGNLYKLYKNPNYEKERDDEQVESFMCYQIMDESGDWTYITGMDYADTYEAYGINGGILYRITSDGITEVKRTDIDQIIGSDNVEFTSTTEDKEDGKYYTYTNKYKTLTGEDTLNVVFREHEETEEYEDGETETYTTTTLHEVILNGESLTIIPLDDEEFEDFYYYAVGENCSVEYYPSELNNNPLSIKIETNLYDATINYDIDYEESKCTPSKFLLSENDEIYGWDGIEGLNDCISRYHHANSDYTTFGICQGILYAITNDEVIMLDDKKYYKAICGYYNANSPRTFAYAIADEKSANGTKGVLYEIKGNTFDDIVVKDNTKYWVEIHGCTTATNNFVVGLAKEDANAPTGSIYKINAKTLSLLDDNNDWTRVFGRYSTSTAVSNQCYAYGIRNNKIYQYTKDGRKIISGFWKVDGAGEIVELEDYNITGISVKLPDGQVVTGVDDIKEIVPAEDTEVSDYDIYVTYTTKGFNNNEKYIIRTQNEAENYQYSNPVDTLPKVYDDNCKGLFDNTSGLMTGFITRNVVIVSEDQSTFKDVIDGNGVANRLLEERTYLTLPLVKNPINIVIIKCEVDCIDNSFYPICTGTRVVNDKNIITGVYYGYKDNQYGIFYKSRKDDDYEYKLAMAVPFNRKTVFEIRYTNANDLYKLDILVNGAKVTGSDFTSSVSNYIDAPYYMGYDEVEYGDATYYLADSYIQTKDAENVFEKTYLFENGKYFSTETIGLDLIEVIETKETQATQKVIEIEKIGTGEILELSMDTLYTQMIPICTTADLSVSTDYNLNQLRSDKYEGTTKASLEYVGSYLLDEEKVVPVKPLDADFENTGIARMTNGNYLRLSTDVTTPFYITTGNNVTNQTLYRTEEDSAYTNKYLLKSEVSLDTTLSGCRAVPQGIVYELHTDLPGVVTRTITYNTDSFYINDDKFTNYDNYSFDDYTAIMTFYPQYDYDEETGEDFYIDSAATIFLNRDEERDAQDKIRSEYTFLINSTVESEEFMEIGTQRYSTLGIGEYYYKVNCEKTFTDINTDYLTKVEESGIDEKDKVQAYDGQCWNYNELSYQTIDLNGIDGFTLYIVTNDDVSKEQGIFGKEGHIGFGIKDNVWTLTHEIGYAQKSTVVVENNTAYYLKFEKVNSTLNISLLQDGEWTELFTDIPYENVMNLGYAPVDSDMLSFNGIIDLAQSKVLNTEIRLYKMEQSVKVSYSLDDATYTDIETVTYGYAVNEMHIGYHFTGTLDCYYSELLTSYDLCWVENHTKIDTVIKNELKAADPYYDPTMDENIYDITEFGIYIDDEPQIDRWQTITVTYTTVDKAFYMQPNTEYAIAMDVIEDYDSGKEGVVLVDSPKLVEGVLSDFEHGYAIYTLPNAGYSVFKITFNDKQDQPILSYNDGYDTTPTGIYLEDGKIKYFDNTDTFELFTPTEDTYYLKLYANHSQEEYKHIEYSTDGENFISTNVTAAFPPVEADFILGKGYINEQLGYLHGSIDLKESFKFTEYSDKPSEKTYLFNYFKKIIPYIIDNDERYDLVLTPLLTVRNYVDFVSGFNGIINMEKSDAILPNTRYWKANQITVYDFSIIAKCIIHDSTLPELEIGHVYTEGDKFKTNGKSFEIIETTGQPITELRDFPQGITVGEEVIGNSDKVVDIVIRDSINVEDKYRLVNEKVQVEPEELECYVEGHPNIHSKIELTYDTWYLFREQYTEYEFKITNDDEKELTNISFKKRDKNGIAYPEYVIYQYEYETDSEDNLKPINLLVNTGYQFNGILVLKDSTRGKALFCIPRTWYTYVIKYRKQSVSDDCWDVWDTFVLESTHVLYQRCGYALKGTHDLSNSWIRTSQVLTPFVSFYNNEYIYIVGAPTITRDGKVSDFSATDFIALANMDRAGKPAKIKMGYKVQFSIYTGEDDSNQGIATWLKSLDGFFKTDEDSEIDDYDFRPNYHYIVQYIFGGFGIKVKDVDVMSVNNLNQTIVKKFIVSDGTITVRIIGYTVNDVPYEPKLPEKCDITLIPYNIFSTSERDDYYVTDETQASNISISYRKVDHDYDHFVDDYEHSIDTWYPVELEKQQIDYFGKELNVYAVKVPFGYEKRQGTIINRNPNIETYYGCDRFEFRIKSKNNRVTFREFVPYNNQIKTQKAEFV